jgi:hypothetical protein
MIGRQLYTVCWNELLTNNTDQAGKFYTQLFGWSGNVQQMGPTAYTMFMKGQAPAGGMMAIAPEWGKVPPHWMIYISVEDCEKSVALAKKLGGEILAPPTDVPNVGRFSTMRDPQGAVFSVIKLTTPQ